MAERIDNVVTSAEESPLKNNEHSCCTDHHRAKAASDGGHRLNTAKQRFTIALVKEHAACGHSNDHSSSTHDHDGHSHARSAHDHGHDEGHEHPHDAHDHDYKGNVHGHDHSSHSDSCCSSAVPILASLPEAQIVGSNVRTPIRIMQMDCPTEETLIRKKLGTMKSVGGMEFNLLQRVLTVEHTPESLESVAEAIRSLGFTPELPNSTGKLDAVGVEIRKPWWPLALAGVAAVGSEAVSWLGASVWISAALAILAVVACGLTTYKKGWVAISNGNLNINALMSIAVTGALVLRQWPEAAMVMVLFTIAELIEAKSLDRARNAIKGLMQLTPATATVRQADGSWTDIDAKSVTVGAVVRVKPGERIGLDGTVVGGRSTVNQTSITGESLPVDKTQGDYVFAGTINEVGSLEFAVTAIAGNTTLARIIHAIEEAQGAKAPTQRFVDQFARIYTPVVFAVALGVAILPPLIAGGNWQDWVYKALVLLVIACPCALVISTPVTIVSGLAAAARKGILVKGGAYLEEGRKLTWLALDKTGTITHGKPEQTDFEMLDSAANSDLCRRVASSLAGRSDHPVSLSIAKAGQAEGLSRLNVDNFEAIPGRGVRGMIDSTTYTLGNHRLVEELGQCSLALEARLESLEQQGKTVVVLSDKTHALALFAVADTVKETSRAAIAELHQLGIRTAMLTGDNTHTAKTIAQAVGIDESRGNQLPEDKLKAVVDLSADGSVVGMVGDGINDAPALARANIGFAMGAMGTDTAIETADVALMDDDLRKIPAFVRLSKSTHTILVQNIVLALSIKVVFLTITLVGFGTMWMAVFADVGASLLVVGNGLRLLRK
ncbi:heavy metal translocating P-type ATPase [Robbsia sp. Bb-Pol-6]|uniref:P-type Zn(2+) transporter n=1 Tax=Robbsia betulipollinis TaxID=2981849 RepID=A0ABT3ZPC7_9BURK|nr:heavy metal translocating P-type ATPase [Robbsia betulipollinis]MCY0388399.1 heavy metal translocating P-type ATPase [Robbsia betulipollinis]